MALPKVHRTSDSNTRIESLGDMERVVALRLLVILLAFSHLLIFSHAVPSTRAQRMLHETRGLPAPKSASQIIGEEDTTKEFTHGRMDSHTNDYPGSGANNRHTPKPPERR